MQDQPKLEWKTADGSWSLWNTGSGSDLSGFRVQGQPFVPGPLFGDNHAAGAACIGFNATTQAVLRLGTRYAAKWSVVQNDQDNPTSGGEWRGHGLSTVGNRNSYVKFEILDGESPLKSAIVHGGVPYTSDSTIAAGFCEIDGQMRFIAWLHTDALNGWNAFGSGNCFLHTPVSAGDMFDGPVSISGAGRLWAAGEKYGMYSQAIAAMPTAPADILQSAGLRLASLRPHHENVMRIAHQTNDLTSSLRRYLRIPEVDLHGHHEFSPEGSPLNRVIVATSMAYSLNDAASYLPANTKSNLHHDAAVNGRLASLSISGTQITTDEGAQEIPQIECAHVGDCCNDYAGSATAGGEPSHALISLRRRDSLQPDRPSSYGDIQFESEYRIQFTLKSKIASFARTVLLTQQQSDDLLAGSAITIPLFQTGNDAVIVAATG